MNNNIQASVTFNNLKELVTFYFKKQSASNGTDCRQFKNLGSCDCEKH